MGSMKIIVKGLAEEDHGVELNLLRYMAQLDPKLRVLKAERMGKRDKTRTSARFVIMELPIPDGQHMINDQSNYLYAMKRLGAYAIMQKDDRPRRRVGGQTDVQVAPGQVTVLGAHNQEAAGQ